MKKDEKGMSDEKLSNYKSWGEEMQIGAWIQNEETSLVMPVCSVAWVFWNG